ncbi:hypothetical protein VINI7043_08445 [Vibrio nigripulchritudo ATCC 27043]|uniref:hypothetical protein n=1 Tax=Vibrio nigripulchritudo TaxID=28173 RepID=UPI00021C1C1B|nr:hypothetical protein [Vibrio nigripulchritudo]EGU56405.1 hypothetical protein VINI7043_08445 [Vibrio nigripulchritudo ATCC 27043]
MHLELHIKSGSRSGEVIRLNEVGSIVEPASWIRENEAIELVLSAPSDFQRATLNLYDHRIPATYVDYDENRVIFIWKPQRLKSRSLECLFINYFGLAELSVELEDENESKIVKSFAPLEVFASKINAKNVEDMLSYLATLGDEQLHSLFQTTKHGAGFKEGSTSPNGSLERLEKTIDKLSFLFQNLFAKPITKLLPEHRVLQASGEESLDDSALGWLLDNLSVVEEVDDIDRAHFEFDSRMYKAHSIQVPELKENSNVYENQVIHGFIVTLLNEADKQLSNYNKSDSLKSTFNEQMPEGYSSFFTQVNRFKKVLLGNQIERCLRAIDRLKFLKHSLDKSIPVTNYVLDRPILTQKAEAQQSYRGVFIEYINWFEKSSPDWSVYQNLLAIKSIPALFEAYSYYRIGESLNNILNPIRRPNSNSTFMHDIDGNEITLVREPIYWMPKNSRSNESLYINSEGKVIRQGKVKPRSSHGKYSHRSPDVVIEVRKENESSKLIILDAKYTYPNLAFSKYLPDCTLKYVHGIHNRTNNDILVCSMTIVHPVGNEDKSLQSFHAFDYSIEGKMPVSPSLQTFGIKLGVSQDSDNLTETLKLLLKHAGATIPENLQLPLFTG